VVTIEGDIEGSSTAVSQAAAGEEKSPGQADGSSKAPGEGLFTEASASGVAPGTALDPSLTRTRAGPFDADLEAELHRQSAGTVARPVSASASLEKFADVIDDQEVGLDAIMPSLKAFTDDEGGTASGGLVRPNIAPYKPGAGVLWKGPEGEQVLSGVGGGGKRSRESVSPSPGIPAVGASLSTHSKSSKKKKKKRSRRRTQSSDASDGTYESPSSDRSRLSGRRSCAAGSTSSLGSSRSSHPPPSRGALCAWLLRKPLPWIKESLVREAWAELGVKGASARREVEVQLECGLFWLHAGASALRNPADGGNLDGALLRAMLSAV